MLNGRTGSHDFTNISSKGKSVVDYVLTPHEQICDFVDFHVHTMSNVVTFKLPNASSTSRRRSITSSIRSIVSHKRAMVVSSAKSAGHIRAKT
jgi:hypothetical protein